MFRRIILSTTAVLASSAMVVSAGPKEDLQAAVQKLADAPNYGWTTTVEGGFGNAGATEGKTEKAGYTMITMSMFNNDFVIVSKDDKTVIKGQDGTWQTPAELTAAAPAAGGGRGNPGMFIASQLQNFKAPTAQAKAMTDKLTDVKKTDDGFSADMNVDTVKEQLAFRGGRGGRRGGAAPADGQAAPPAPEVKDPKGALKFWVKDGMVSKVEVHVTASMSFNGNDFPIDRTTTTEVKEVGTTKLDVPAEAKTKLAAAPAPAPATPPAP